MKAMILQLMLVPVICVAAPGATLAGTCKLSIVIDHSGSMTGMRTDGHTRCYNAAMGARNALAAYMNANRYEIGGGEVRSTGDVYGQNCSNVSDRLASVWVFWSSDPATGEPTMYHITASASNPGGFIPVATAIYALAQSGLVLDPTSLEPVDHCYGLTPLAQTMCRSARDFAAGPAPAGEVRQAIIFTDGEENRSDVVAVDSGESRCRLPGEPTTADPNSGWGARVISEYTSRSITANGFLFGGGLSSDNMLYLQAVADRTDPLASDRVGQAMAAGSGAMAPAASAEDQAFFQALAQLTGGYYTYAADNVTLDPTRDTDGDGIPDHRDFCLYTTCAGSDLDQDGIPDLQDQCVFTKEDGRGAYPADGCPDTDGDGVPDVYDQCPTTFEDWLPPNRDDGCPAPVAAVPAMPLVLTGLLGLGLLGFGAATVKRRNRSSRA